MAGEASRGLQQLTTSLLSCSPWLPSNTLCPNSPQALPLTPSLHLFTSEQPQDAAAALHAVLVFIPESSCHWVRILHLDSFQMEMGNLGSPHVRRLPGALRTCNCPASLGSFITSPQLRPPWEQLVEGSRPPLFPG